MKLKKDVNMVILRVRSVLNEKINQELSELEMKNAKFNAKVIEDEEFNLNGKSHVEFAISTYLIPCF